MKLLRPFGYLWVLAAALGLIAGNAQARSSNNRNNYSSTHRLVEDNQDTSSHSGKHNDTKKPDSTKKPDTTAPKPTAPKPAPAVVKPPAAPKPAVAKPPAKPNTGTKTDEAREAEATKLLEQANAAFDQGTEQGLLTGVKSVRQILAEYEGTGAAAKAQEQLDLLLKNQDYGPMILLAEAQEEFDAQHYRKARNKFQELVQRFPNSAQAADGRARLEEIEKNDLLKKTVYTDEELEDARLWLLAGNIHLENGRKSDAASAYRRVIEEYPGCRFAVLAEEKLPTTRGS